MKQRNISCCQQVIKVILKPPYKYSFLLLLGALLTLAYHPFDIFIAVPVSFSCFLLILDEAKTGKSRFITGLIYGYGHFITSLYWIIHALLTDVTHFGWMIPIVLVAVPMTLACFIGLLSVASSYFNYHKIAYAIGFSILWVAFEVIRSYVILPFPWNLLGYTSLASNYFAQFASVVGVYGMSFIICILSTCFYTKNLKYVSIVLCCYISIIAFGYFRLDNSQTEYIENFNFRLVQPNLAEHHMGDPKKQSSDFLKLIELSLKDLKDNTITIWPEGAFPYLLSREPIWNSILSGIVAKGGYLIMGADWIEAKSERLGWDSYNSIITINQAGEVSATYHKTILVPFGEYIPLRQYLPGFINKVAYGIGDFKVGEKKHVMIVDRTLPPILNLICFEAIFTHIPLAYSDKQAGLLLNITNDAWFGDSIGPYQHYNMARMRAIEYGMPLIRVAKHGITAVFDQYGRVIDRLELNQEGVLDLKVPKKTLHSTFYLLYYYISIACIITMFLLLILAKKKFN